MLLSIPHEPTPESLVASSRAALSVARDSALAPPTSRSASAVAAATMACDSCAADCLVFSASVVASDNRSRT